MVGLMRGYRNPKDLGTAYNIPNSTPVLVLKIPCFSSISAIVVQVLPGRTRSLLNLLYIVILCRIQKELDTAWQDSAHSIIFYIT